MGGFKWVISLLVFCSLMACVNKDNKEQTGPKQVTLVKEKGKYRLHVNGKPFYVKGAGCEFGNIEKLSQYGANSLRTWRTNNGRQTGKEVLDQAHENGLMVLMGLDLGRERHGYDYSDTSWVNKQFREIKQKVLQYKDHPALLAWGIGNELNLNATNMKVWDAVNDIAEMIHEVDPNHPATTMLAGISKKDADYIEEHARALDFLSIQMYSDIVNLQTRLAEAGYEGPYMITEWGATGHWEVPRTSWDAPIEQTSTEKARAFKKRYQVAIAADSLRCLGSYVFLWGQKQERTPTWYGMFLETGEETATVDMMHYIWKNEWPANRCPAISQLKLNEQTRYENVKVQADAMMNASVDLEDPDDDSLKIVWEILPESTDLGEGGDHESRPETILEIEGKQQQQIKAPSSPGAYRLFVYGYDQKSNAATGNIPFYVE